MNTLVTFENMILLKDSLFYNIVFKFNIFETKFLHKTQFFTLLKKKATSKKFVVTIPVCPLVQKNNHRYSY